MRYDAMEYNATWKYILLCLIANLKSDPSFVQSKYYCWTRIVTACFFILNQAHKYVRLENG